MPNNSFEAVSIPFEQIDKLAISGGYSTFYPAQEPAVKIWGDWRQRYCSLADTFKPVLERVYNFDVREDDIYIVTSTKCGTTWAQEMTWLILNDFDFERAKQIDLTIRSPFLEFNGVVPNVPHDTIEAANGLESPRLLKSHLPAMLLPKEIWTKKPKIIYVFRNPKDAAVSYFHHWRGMVGYKGTKEDFVQSYMDGHVNFNPFWPHVLDFWYMRNSPQVFFTSYERMKFNLGAVIQDVCHFLNKTVNDRQLEQMIDHLSFDKMKDNPACNHVKEFESMKAAAGREVDEFRFVRRGIVNSHKDELPANVIKKLDEWTCEYLNDLNLSLEDFTSYSKY
ncbi:sulfotransferase 1 family member D1 [Musca vetustissima]|uniref:sulfotransferase 1 family member D1 n=1 Tax=Musca vetustissima TaxID=27455 RepID=UPI002AB6D1DC|nr:sulfotransferase 1 family member D1 [Musca vetustissima]